MSQSQEIFLRLINAESGNQPLLGRALVARAVLNRHWLIAQGVVPPSKFNSKSADILDIVSAPRQFQPYDEGKLNKPLSTEERDKAMLAVKLALDADKLKKVIVNDLKVDETEANKMLAVTGFSTHDATPDRSQTANTFGLAGHKFTTAGNDNTLVLNSKGVVPITGATTNTDSGAFPYPAPEQSSLIPQSQTLTPDELYLTHSKANNDLMLGLQYGLAAQGKMSDKLAAEKGANTKSDSYKLGRNLAKGGKLLTETGLNTALMYLTGGLGTVGPLAKTATQLAKAKPITRDIARTAIGFATAGGSNLITNVGGSLFAPQNKENIKNNLTQAAITGGIGGVTNAVLGRIVDANTAKAGAEAVLGKVRTYAQSTGKSIEELAKGGDQEVINIFKSIADDYTQLVKPFDDVIKSGVDTKKLSKEAYKELVDQVSNATKPIIDNMKAAGGQVIANQTKKVKLPEGLIDTLKLIQKNAVFTRGDSKGPKKLAEQIDSIISSAGLDSKDRVVEKISTDLPEWKMIPTKTTQIVVKPPKATEANAEAIVNSIKEIKALMKDVPAAKKFADLLDPYVDTITDSVPSLKFAKDVDKVYSDVLKGFGIDPTDVELSTMAKIVKKSVADPSYIPSADKLVSLMDNPKLRITTKGTPLEGKISILNPEIQAQRVKEAQAAKELVQYQFGKGKPGATTMFNLIEGFNKSNEIPQIDKITKAFLDSDVGSLIGNTVKNQKVKPEQVEKAYMFSFAKNAKKVEGLTKQAEARFANPKTALDTKALLSGENDVANLATDEGVIAAKNLPNNPISGAANFFSGKQYTPVRTNTDVLYPSPRDVVKQAVNSEDAIRNALGNNFTQTPMLGAAVTERLAPARLDALASEANNLMRGRNVTTMIDQGKGFISGASDAPVNVTNTGNLIQEAAFYNSLRPVAAPFIHGGPGGFESIIAPLYKGNATINERR
jgi:hypothetical protein